MAIPILNHLDFRYCAEAQNLIIHKTTESSATNTEGAIIYDTGTDTLKYRNASAWVSLTAAATGTNITVADTTDTTCFVGLWEDATGDLAPKTDAGITYNAGTGTLTATAFSGPITGNVTGNASGTALTVTQAAQTSITSLGTLTALTVDDVVIDGKVVTMTGSSGDTAVLTVGTNGTLSVVTTDTAAAAANIQITADGTAELAGTTVNLDSSGGIDLDADNGVISFNDAGVSLGTISSSGYSGVSATATALATARSISMTGDVAWTVSFDGSAVVTAAGTIQANAVDSAEITSGAIDLAHMSVNSVDSDQYVDGSIDNAHLAANSVDSDNYVDGSIDTAHIADDAVTGAKLSNDVTIANDLTVTGDLLVSGDTVTVNTATLSVEDPLIGMANGNGANSVDIGIFGKYTATGAKYSGLFRDASDSNIWKLFATTGNSHEAPGTGTTINTTSGFTLGHLELDTIEATTVTIPDNAIAVGKIAAGALPSDVTVNNGNWSGTDLSVANGGTGASSLSNLITLTTHTTGDYVGTLTGGTGITSTAATSGEGTTHSISVDTSQTQITAVGDIATGQWSATSIPITNTDAKVTSIVAGDGIDVSGATGDVTVTAEAASATNAGGVELATCAEVITGTDTARAVTPAGLGCRSVVSAIDISDSNFTSNLYAEIDHGFATADVTVQIYDIVTEKTVYADVERKDKGGTASTAKVTVKFACAPANDLRVIITSGIGATAKTAVYV